MLCNWQRPHRASILAVFPHDTDPRAQEAQIAAARAAEGATFGPVGTRSAHLALAFGLTLLACKRDSTCSAVTLEKFTPSVGLVLGRVHADSQARVERDVWTGTEPCGSPETDTSCESRATLEARKRTPKGAEFKLTRGKKGEPEKWRGTFRAPSGLSLAMPPKQDLGVFKTAGDCEARLHAIPRAQFGGGACNVTPGKNGERQTWTGWYRRPLTSSDFPAVPDALPADQEVGIYDTLEECQTSTTSVAPSGYSTSCGPAGSWTYEIRVFTHEMTGAVQHTVNLRWSPPADDSFEYALSKLREDVRNANLVIVTEPAQAGDPVVIACP